MINNFKSKLAKDKHFSELLKGSSVAFIFKIFGIGLGYIFTLIVARLFGAGTIGVYSLSLIIFNIFAMISIFGFDSALVKFVADYNSSNRIDKVKEVYLKTLFFVLPVSILLSFVLFLSAGYISQTIFDKEKLTVFLEVMAFSIPPFVLLKINAALFRGLKRISFFSLFDTFGFLLLNIICVIVAVWLFNYTNDILLAYIQFTSLFLLAIISLYTIKKYTKIYEFTSKNILKIGQILKVSFPMLLTSSIALIMSWTDIIMIGIFQSESEVGIYSVVVKVAALASVMLMVVGTILGPKIAEFWTNEDMNNLKNIIKQSTKLIFFTSLPILVVIIIFSKNILLFFGEEFASGATALIILSINQLFYAFSGDTGMFLKMTNNQTYLLKLNLFVLLINIVLNYILIQYFGINGAAIATTIALVIAKILANNYIKRKYNFNFYLNLYKDKN